MKPQLLSAKNCDPKLFNLLKVKLDNFYNTVSDYSAFETHSDQRHCWKHIADRIKLLGSSSKKIKILEVGAGRSGFGLFLTELGLRDFVIWVAQDVTSQNSKWLEANADKVILGDIETMPMDDSYDIIFSTFVLEHIVNPSDHLNQIASLLKLSKGTLFIFCPRYDLPCYLAPSSRHLTKNLRIKFLIYCTFSRIKTILTGKPAFLIMTDLAAFHQPFFTDSDAVHWPSLYDLKSFSRKEGAILSQLEIGAPKLFSRDWIVKRLLTIAVTIKFD